jgi:hypothetical protein
MKKIFFTSMLLIIFYGYSKEKFAVRKIANVMDSGMEVIMQENDLHTAEISLLSNIKLIETFIAIDPKNEKLLLFASMGYGSYALGYLEDTLPQRASNIYWRGKEYGMRILREKSQFKETEKSDLESFEKSLKAFSKNDVPYIFWTAYNWGNYINLNLSDPETISEFSKVNAMMQFVLDNDETYYYGAAHLYFGTTLSKMPAVLGGNVQKSKEHFDKCIAINKGNFLMVYVYYARMYAVAMQDEELFTELLNKVIATPYNIDKDLILPNIMAQEKAKYHLANMEEYF